MNTTGVLLLALALASIVNYFTQILGFILDRSWMETDSKGVKNLKFQEWNSTWQKYTAYKTR